MYLGDDPDPGFIGPVQPYPDEEPAPGTPEFAAMAAARRRAIAGSTLPQTNAPPFLYLPMKAIGTAARGAVEAAGNGLFEGLGTTLVLGGLALGAFFFFRSRR